MQSSIHRLMELSFKVAFFRGAEEAYYKASAWGNVRLLIELSVSRWAIKKAH